MTDDWTKAQENKDLPDDKFEEIKSFYLSKIFIPENKPTMQIMLCPVGVVGAGKSTVVIPLAKKLNLVRVSTDEIRKILKEKDFNYNRAREIALNIISDFLEKGFSIAVDANCGSKESFEKIKEIEQKYKLKIIWIFVNPHEKFIVDKLKNYKHTWLFKDGEDAVDAFYKYKNNYIDKFGDWSHLNINLFYTFDTSKNDIKDQIEKCYIKIVDEIFR